MKIDITKVYSYGTKTLAYYDALFSGLIAVKVIDILDKENKVVVTKTHRGYKKGDILTVSHYYCIPRRHMYKSGIYIKVRTNYKWSKPVDSTVTNKPVDTPQYDQFLKDSETIQQSFRKAYYENS